jgi:Rrf2 family cysteine metabolism transcriptional repressor
MATSAYRRVTFVLVITTKSPYAVRALAELARRGNAAPVPIGEIARARDIPVQFLEGLFATLRRAGILQSQRGVKGGYTFAREPSDVTVLEVVELLEGELGADAAASSSPVWAEAVDAVRSVLAGTTIADMAEREAQAAGAPMYYI